MAGSSWKYQIQRLRKQPRRINNTDVSMVWTVLMYALSQGRATKKSSVFYAIWRVQNGTKNKVSNFKKVM